MEELSITNILLAVTVLISFIGFNNRPFFNQLAHIPSVEARDKSYYRLFTSGFLHGDFFHLLINCFVIYSFGNYVEYCYKAILGEVAGRNLFLIFYILTVGASSLLSYFKHQNNPGYSAIGASGGAAGLLFTYVLLDPWEKIYLYGVFGLPAIIFGVLYLGYETYLGKQNNDNIGHDAHISGAIFGFIFSAVVLKGVLVEFFEKLSAFHF